MKKNLIVMAVLGAACGTAAAQSAVTIYGYLDLALVRESGGAAGSVTKLTSGVSNGSRIGFKGKEDLGNGMSALFLLESGYQADTGVMGQGGLLFGRQAYVGLQSGAGTITVGRQYTPQYLTVAAVDPFGSGYAGDTKNLIAPSGAGAGRMDNTIKYASPVMGGVSGELVYAPGEIAGSNTSGRQMGGALGYAGGPFMVRLGYHYRNNETAADKTLSSARNTILGATYDFVAVKLHVAYVSDKGLNSSPLRNTANPYGYAVAPVATLDSRDAVVGATIPFGPHTVIASYTRKDDRGVRNQDASQAAIGYRYALSKRTDVYAVYAHMDNKRGASYTVGSAIEPGSGNAAVNLGMRHFF